MIMNILVIIADILGVFSALFAFTQAVSARKDKKEIEKYKETVSSKIIGQEIASLYSDAKRIEKIIIRNTSKKTIQNGKNAEEDKKSILEFVARIKVNQSILEKDIGNGYFEKMNSAIMSTSYSDMYVHTCDLLDHLKCIKDKVTL